MRKLLLIGLIWPLLIMSFSGCLKKKAAAPVAAATSSTSSSTSSTSTSTSTSTTTTSTASTAVTSSGEVVSTITQGYDIPTKINTIPEATASSDTLNGRSLGVREDLFIYPRTVASDSDYVKDGVLQLKVSEPALDQFSIIEQVMGAIAQTGFNLPEILKAVADGGYRDTPYAALITWEDNGGNGQTSIETWTVQSRMVHENDKDINRANFWIKEVDGSNTKIVKGLVNVYAAPTTTNKYGKWDLNVSFESEAGVRMGTFVASSDEATDGTIQLRVNHSQTGGGHTESLKGKLNIKPTGGSGIVTFNDWDSCTSNDCTPPSVTSRYSYNTNHVIIKKGDKTAKCKSRTSSTNVYMDYNVYTAEGKNLRKDKNFSFPLKYSNGWYFYNGWQGRQQLNGQGAKDLALGTTMTRGDYFGSGSAPTYTIDARYSGYLVKKTLISIDLSEMKGEVYEGNTNQNFCLKYVSGGWKKFSSDCTSNQTDYSSSISSLNVTQPSRTWVDIRNMDNNWQQTSYGSLSTNGTRYMVNISTPVFLSYDGTSWYNNTPDYSKDQWNPSFTLGSAYTSFDAGKTMYLRTNQGLNYLLTISNAGVPTSAQKETQTVVRPGTTLASANTTFTDDQSNSYTWDSTTMMLKQNSATKTQPVWRLTGGTDGANYSWEYVAPNQEFGILTYLKDSSSQVVLLDQPVFFDDVPNITVNGTAQTIKGIFYDGHLNGIPDVWQMLQKNREGSDKEAGLTTDQKTRVVNIPAGTEVTSSGTTYLIKPRFGIKVLDSVSQDNCTVTLDTTLDLEGLPTFKEHNMGAIPTTTGILVSGGVFLKK